MIFVFKILSDEVEGFKREVRIDTSATFFDLQNAILNSCGYTHQEMTSFFLCDEDWRKEQEITLIPMDTDSETDNYVMEETPLEELLEDEGQNLLFVFDYLSERAFFMELAEIIPCESLPSPIISKSHGQAPQQTSTIEIAEARSVSGQQAAIKQSQNVFDEDDLYSDEGLDDDDLLSLDELSADDMY